MNIEHISINENGKVCSTVKYQRAGNSPAKGFFSQL